MGHKNTSWPAARRDLYTYRDGPGIILCFIPGHVVDFTPSGKLHGALHIFGCFVARCKALPRGIKFECHNSFASRGSAALLTLWRRHKGQVVCRLSKGLDTALYSNLLPRMSAESYSSRQHQIKAVTALPPSIVLAEHRIWFGRVSKVPGCSAA